MSPAPSSPSNNIGIEPAAVAAFLRELGGYQMEGYRNLSQAEVAVKDDSAHGFSVVTEFDVESERRTRAFLDRHCPGDSFLGEETGNLRRHPARTWILDPIDGTSNFTQGIPFWGPSLALWDELGPRAGWVLFPALEQLFFAERGGGAYLNGKPIRSSSVREYSNLCTVGTVSRLHRRYRLTCPAKHRILGSIVVNLCYLAMGSFAACFCRGNLWDIAAGILIAREAGAAVDTEPELAAVDVAAIDPKGGTSSISVYAMANRELPHLRPHLVPLEKPIEGK